MWGYVCHLCLVKGLKRWSKLVHLKQTDHCYYLFYWLRSLTGIFFFLFNLLHFSLTLTNQLPLYIINEKSLDWKFKTSLDQRTKDTFLVLCRLRVIVNWVSQLVWESEVRSTNSANLFFSCWNRSVTIDFWNLNSSHLKSDKMSSRAVPRPICNLSCSFLTKKLVTFYFLE